MTAIRLRLSAPARRLLGVWIALAIALGVLWLLFAHLGETGVGRPGDIPSVNPAYGDTIAWTRPGAVVARVLGAGALVLSAAGVVVARRRLLLAVPVGLTGAALGVLLIAGKSPLTPALSRLGVIDDAAGGSAPFSPLALGLFFAWSLALLLLALVSDRNAWARTLYGVAWALALLALMGPVKTLVAARPEEMPVAESLRGQVAEGLRQNLQSALQAPLENGATVSVEPGNYLSVQPGASARQAMQPPHAPLFKVTGATYVEYLRTGVGDVYADGAWRQLDPLRLTYAASADVPALLERVLLDRDAASPELRERLDAGLLAPSLQPRTSAFTVTARVAAAPPFQGFGKGALPVSTYLRSATTGGDFRPLSHTLHSAEKVSEYSWESQVYPYSDLQLRQAIPTSDPAYVQLPPDLPPRIGELARAVTARAPTTYERARAIQRYLLANYEYGYADDEPDPAAVPDGQDPVDWFLFESKRGTCGNFSSAFVILARSVGIPARVVSGWAIAPTRDAQTVYADQAHQWAEVAFSDVGWIAFEVTPGGAPRRALRGAARMSRPLPTPTPAPTATPLPVLVVQATAAPATPPRGSGSTGSAAPFPTRVALPTRAAGAPAKATATSVAAATPTIAPTRIPAATPATAASPTPAPEPTAVAGAPSGRGPSPTPVPAETAIPAGAREIVLENGTRVLVERGGGIGIASAVSATARQAGRVAPMPVFTVSGAGRTTRLRTGTGDRYEGGAWLQHDPARLEYRPSEELPRLVELALRDAGVDTELARASSINPSLLALPSEPPSAAHLESLSLAPVSAAVALGPGAIPVSAYLLSATTGGDYRPFSRTFEAASNVRGYAWDALVSQFSDDQLTAASLAAPLLYTELPANLPARIRDLAQEITASTTTAYDRARAIERYLLASYEYGYADDEPNPAPVPEGRDPVDWFLFESKRGTCGNFSSAFVILARSVGIPARVVSGWAIAPIRDAQTVYTDQAHQWAEVAFQGLGWVAFDPTPGGAPARVAARASSLLPAPGPGAPRPAPSPVPAPTPQPTPGPEPVPSPRPGLTPTETEFTSFPSRLTRGGRYFVEGVVRAGNGAPVDGPAIEVYLNARKEQGGVLVGNGVARAGAFRVEITVPRDLPVGAYQGIAHTVGNDVFEESWSDPETEVYSGTFLRVSGPSEVMVGTEVEFSGAVTQDNGDPVTEGAVEATAEGATRRLTPDAAGRFHFSHVFASAGTHTVRFHFTGARYLLEQSADLRVRALIPVELQLELPELLYVGDVLRVNGRLQTAEARPRAGERVELTLTPLSAESPTSTAAVVANADGAFSWETAVDEPGRYRITARYEGGEALAAAVTQREITVWLPTRLTLAGPTDVLVGEEVRFRVSIATLEDSPAARRIAVRPAGELSYLLTQGGLFLGSGASRFDAGARAGAFAFTRVFTRAGTHSVEVRFSGAPNVESQAVALQVVARLPGELVLDWPREIELGQTVELTGRLQARDGEGVSGRPVSISFGADGAHSATSSVTTDDAGLFQWEVLPETGGVYEIGAKFAGDSTLAPASASAEVAVFVPTELTLAGPDRVPVASAAAFTGRVNTVDGDAIPDAEVRISVDGDTLTAVSDARGQFAFSRAFENPGLYRIEAELEPAGFLRGASGGLALLVYTSTAIELSASSTLTVLDPLTISGVVRDGSGTPLEGAAVHLALDPGQDFSVDATTDASGRFAASRTVARPGTYTLNATVSAGGAYLGSRASLPVTVQTVSIVPDAAPDVVRGQPARFSGALRLASKPLAGEGVAFFWDGQLVLEGATADDGSYAFEFTPSAAATLGRHRAGIDAPRFRERLQWPVRVRARTSLSLSVPADVKRGETATFAARLTDDDGRPVPHGAITVPGRGIATTTDGSGNAALSITAPDDFAETALVVRAEFAGDERYAPSAASVAAPIAEGWNPASALRLWGGLLAAMGAGSAVTLLARRRFSPPPRRATAGGEAAGAPEARSVSAAGDELDLDQPPRKPVSLTITLPEIAPGLPDVWGRDDPLTIRCEARCEARTEDGGRVELNGDAKLAVRVDGEPVDAHATGPGALETRTRFNDPGQHAIACAFDGGEEFAPAAASRDVRIVDYREEVVRLFNAFLDRYREAGAQIPANATPREAEQVLAATGMIGDEAALDRLVSAFEEADYSLHEVGRSEYERAARAYAVLQRR